MRLCLILQEKDAWLGIRQIKIHKKEALVRYVPRLYNQATYCKQSNKHKLL